MVVVAVCVCGDKAVGGVGVGGESQIVGCINVLTVGITFNVF